MLIEFRYKLSNDIAGLMANSFPGFSGVYITGWLNQMDVRFLKKSSLYLVCDTQSDVSSGAISFSHPIGIVARNESDALIYYNIIFGREGSIHSELIQNCKGLSVEATGNTLDSEDLTNMKYIKQ